MRSLRWEADALRQFQDTIAYIAAHDLPAAESLAQDIAGRLELVLQFPDMGRKGRIAGSRELVVHPNYIVIYAVRETSVDVIRFLHSRQLYPQ
jgi:addiction module RelE/StbE family toxin